MKVCTKCGESKPDTEFYRDKRRANGLQARCKACRDAAFKEWRQRNPDWERERYRKTAEQTRYRHILRKYGVTKEQYEAARAAQGNRCAICQRDQNRHMDVDHDHSTGEVRGLLCSSCNRMLGYAHDSVDVLRSAIRYLSSRKSRPSS